MPIETVTGADPLATARELAPQLAELAGANDAAAQFPTRSIQLLHEAGLLQATADPRHGGAGLGHQGVHELLLTLGAADPAVALIASMTLAMHQREASSPVLPPGFYDQLLADAATRPVLINSLQVEPALGTPSRGGIPATTARAYQNGWLLNGHKIFSTGAAGLTWMLVLAATDEPEPRIGTFLVAGDAPGVRVEHTWSATGMRASASDDVLFEDVYVAADRVIGLVPAAGGHRNPLGPGTAIPSIYLGVAYAARDWLVKFLRERTPTNLGHPLIELPRFASELGEMELQLTVARDLLASLSRRADRGEAVSRDSSWAAKVLANRTAIFVVERAVSLVGNPGLSRDNPLERHLRDVLCARVHFPQEDTVIGALGKSVTEQKY